MLNTRAIRMMAVFVGTFTVAAGCSDMNESMPMATGGSAGASVAGGASGTAGAGGAAGTAGSAGTGGGAGSAGSGGVAGSAGSGGSSKSFSVRIDNISNQAELATPLAPGIYVVHDASDPLFTQGKADRGQGLEPLAEDGNPMPLASALSGTNGAQSVGVFDTPVGASSKGPALPGGSFEFTLQAKPGQRLSLATMFGQSNDLFLGPDGAGISLFQGDGTPISGDVSAMIQLWDAGTEENEAPGLGPNQAPRQSAPNTGPSEGRIALRADGTRVLPLAAALVDIGVSISNGTYTFELHNISDKGPFVSPIAPLIHVLHGDGFALFEPGSMASKELERLAEDGDPSQLASKVSSMVDHVDVAGAGPTLPGESTTFSVTPKQSASTRLSLAAMVGQSNDAFIGTLPSGVSLFDPSGQPLAAETVRANLMRSLRIWDAGTEANEVPGAGPNQAPRQPMPDTGPSDPDNHIRIYADSYSDIPALLADGKVKLSITHASGASFDVKYENGTASSPFPALLAPIAWAVHDGTMNLFEPGAMASSGLETLAEDGDPMSFAAELSAKSWVGASGTVGNGPIMNGAFSFQVTADISHRYFDIVGMLAPSNDMFFSLGPMGIALLDPSGTPRPDAAIAADVATALRAWDAGTEANEASAYGPNMAPFQPSPNTGHSEGSGLVRPVSDVWYYPPVRDLVRVTITPQ